MNVRPLFRKVLLGAAESSLEVAGLALLPGAWPILKGALAPVLERLKERLGGEDPTSSAKVAQKAVEAFEADPILQEMMRSRLLERLDQKAREIAEGQEKIDADVQMLMMFASGNQELLEKIIGNTDQIVRTLDEGVDLSPEAYRKLAEAVNREAQASREVRAMALREMGPVAELLARQVGRLQQRAVELVQEGAPDRALDELREGLMLVAALLNEAPTDRRLRLHLGYLYKALAQVFHSMGDADQVKAYLDRVEEISRLVQEDVTDAQRP